MKTTSTHQGPPGFTLIELLIVLVIILSLVALLVPIASTVGSANLQQGIEMLHSRISWARQSAIRENRPVEVRFYWYDGAQTPSGEAQFRAIQVIHYQPDPAGGPPIAEPISDIEKLPNNIVIINHPDFSTLVTAPELAGATPVEVEGATGDATYHAFSFFPDGSTNLRDDEAGAWFLTVVEEPKLLSTGGALPANFITLQIEPFNGALRRLQP